MPANQRIISRFLEHLKTAVGPDMERKHKVEWEDKLRKEKEESLARDGEPDSKRLKQPEDAVTMAQRIREEAQLAAAASLEAGTGDEQ